jgi:hypothetical protein
MNVPVEIQCLASATFEEFPAQAGGSLVISTNQAGKAAMIGSAGRRMEPDDLGYAPGDKQSRFNLLAASGQLNTL